MRDKKNTEKSRQNCLLHDSFSFHIQGGCGWDYAKEKQELILA